MATHNVVVNLIARGQQASAEFKKVSASAGELEKSLGKTQGAAGQFGGQLVAAMKGAPAVFAAGGVALGFLIKTAFDGVKAFTGWASEVRSFQRVTGTSAETASKFSYALDALGIGATNGGNAIFMLSKKIGSGKSKLDEFGISVQKSADGGVDLVGTLLNISDAYNKTNDPARKAAIAMEAFGRQGKTLIPLLARGREGLKALFDEAKNTNHLLSQEDLDRAKEFGLATNELSNTFEGLQIKVGNALTPILTDLARIGSSLVQLADKAHIFDAWATEIQIFLGPLKIAADEITALGHAFGLLDDSMAQSDLVQKVLTDNTKKYNDLVAEGKGKTKEAKEALDQVREATALTSPAQEKLGEAMKGAAQQAQDQANALRDLTTQLFAVTGASRGPAEAQLRLADAQDQVAAAVDNLNAARVKGKDANESDEQYARRIAGLERDVQSAMYGVADAHDAVAKAAVDALTSQQNFDAAAKDPKARAALIGQLQDARNKFGDATGAIGEAITKLQAYDNTNPKDKTIRVDNSQALGAVGEVLDYMANLHDVALNVNVHAATVISDQQRTLMHELGVPGFARGGTIPPNSLALVGENGPELARTGSQPTHITPNSALAGLSGNGGDTYHITVQSLVPTAQTGKLILEHLRKAKRDGGADTSFLN